MGWKDGENKSGGERLEGGEGDERKLSLHSNSFLDVVFLFGDVTMPQITNAHTHTSYPVQHHSAPPGGSGDPQLAAHCLGRDGQEGLFCHLLWVPVSFLEPSTSQHDLEDKVASSGAFQN